MPMTDSHGWEVLDMNKITVYLADLKNTITGAQEEINERLDNLSNRLDMIDIKLNKCEQHVKNVNETINSNYKIYERNKMLYMEILERLSDTNERVKPLLEKLNRKDALTNPFVQSSRVYNRFWRASVIPQRSIDKSISPSLLEDIVEINEENENENINEISFDTTFV